MEKKYFTFAFLFAFAFLFSLQTVVAENVDVRLIYGEISENDSLAALSPFVNLSNGTLETYETNSTNYTLELYDDTTLLRVFNLSAFLVNDSEPEGILYFNVRINFTAGVNRVVVKNLTNDLILLEINKSANPPQVSNISINKVEDLLYVNWTSTDLDDDRLVVDFYYLMDDFPVYFRSFNGSDHNYTINTTFLPGGNTVNVSLVAYDYFHSTLNTSSSFDIANKAPMTFIYFPFEHSNFSNSTYIPPNPEIDILFDGSNLSSFIFNWNTTDFTIFNDSLVLMYNFENLSVFGENDSLVVDHSLYGNNGTVTNAIPTTDGKYGGAYSFDGDGDYMIVSEDDSLKWASTDSFSKAVWFMRVGTDSSVAPGIIQQERTHLSLDRTGTPLCSNPFEIFSYIAASATCTGIVAAQNQWYHVVVDYDNTQLKIYVDGVLAVSSTRTLESQAGKDNFFGATSTSAGYFNGSMDEVRIWNRSLSATEVQQLYFTNFQKQNSTRWNLHVNQSLNSTTTLPDGTYTYFASITSGNGSANVTETQTVEIEIIDLSHIPFSGWAYDPELGELNNSFNYTWTSSIDGFIGNGSKMMNDSLSVGDHLITLTVSDDVGNVGTDMVNISIFNSVDPDVKVEAVVFSNNTPEGGDDVWIFARLSNVIRDTWVTVSFYIDDPDTGGTLLGSFMVEVFANTLNLVSFLWEDAPEGEYEIFVNITNSSITESDLTNNVGSSFINVSASTNTSINISVGDYDFDVRDSSGSIVAGFNDTGDIVLVGSCYSGGNCDSPGDGSFVVRDSSGNNVAFVNSSGDLCVEVGDCSDLSATCNPSSDAFIIRNLSSTNVSYIDYAGDLCLTGNLYENANG